MAKRKFTIVLIKPSHYDDDGYVIQWRRSTIPSNSLASVYGLLLECAEARVLGPDVEIGFEIYDECNTIIDFPSVSRRILADGGMVALVGVQSNQFPRALDIGRQFRKQGVTVAVGGFHVSGCIAMLPELPPDLKEAQSLGMILYAGEGENRLAEFLKDVDSGKPKPVYNYLNDMPDMAAAAIPVLPRPVVTQSPATTRASTPDAAARSSAASAPSSMSRGASRAIARLTMSRRSCAPMPSRASRAFSSPTTISPATATGSRSSTG